MPGITSENLAQAIVKLVASEALPAVVGNLRMGQLVNRNYENALANEGQTVSVPIPPVMTAKNIAEGGTVVTQNPTPGSVDITLNKHIESSFIIPDVTRILTTPEALGLYMQPAVIAVAEAIEKDLTGLYALLTNSVGSSSAAITEDAIDDAETFLFNQKVPMNLPRYLMLHGDVYATARQVARFTEADKIGSGDAIASGVLPRVKDFGVDRSQYIVKTGTPVYYNLAFCRDAFSLVMRRLPEPLPGTGAIASFVEMGGYGMRVIMSYNANSLSQQFTIDVLYGTGTLRQNWACQVLCNG